MSRGHTRFIPGEDVRGVVTGWDFSSVDPPSERFAAKLKAQAMSREKMEKTAQPPPGFSDGYAQGYAQGNAQATVQAQQQFNAYLAEQGAQAARNLDSIFTAAKVQLAQQEELIAEGVLELACEIARQILRQELSVNPKVLLSVVREALGMLCAQGQTVHVRMHPADAQILAHTLPQEHPEVVVHIVPDASLTQGGCLFECDGSVIDARIEKRWLRAAASLGLDVAWDVGDVSHT